MHIVGSRDFVDLRSATQNLDFVSLTDFSGFLCKVGTRQKRKIGTIFFCVFLLLVVVVSSSSHIPHAYKNVSFGFWRMIFRLE